MQYFFPNKLFFHDQTFIFKSRLVSFLKFYTQVVTEVIIPRESGSAVCFV